MGLGVNRKEKIFLLLGWLANNIGSQDKIMFLIRIEFGWLNFMLLDFFYIRLNVFSICYQCTNFVQKSCSKRKRCLQLSNRNTDRNNMLEIPCYMRESACRWFIVKKVKIFWSYVKHFLILAGMRKCRILIGLFK